LLTLINVVNLTGYLSSSERFCAWLYLLDCTPRGFGMRRFLIMLVAFSLVLPATQAAARGGRKALGIGLGVVGGLVILNEVAKAEERARRAEARRRERAIRAEEARRRAAARRRSYSDDTSSPRYRRGYDSSGVEIGGETSSGGSSRGPASRPDADALDALKKGSGGTVIGQ
jgi:hypothetical protein